jgi:organic radical activating enzyme
MNLQADLYTENGHLPNLTIIVPGKCNAKCKFCYWNREDGNIIPPTDYKQKLISILQSLPAELCPAISVTGGEPTISPYFKVVLDAIKKSGITRDRIVLNTNGAGFSKYSIDDLLDLGITNINLSRHHDSEKMNNMIFGSEMITVDEIQTLLNHSNKGADKVTINCVIDETCSRECIIQMLDFCHRLAPYRPLDITFRNVATVGTKLSTAELFFRWTFPILSDNSCPVCSATTQDICGVIVTWKSGNPEPSQHLNKIYEFVIHPDGKLYADWSRKLPVYLTTERQIADTYSERQLLAEIAKLRKENEILRNRDKLLTACALHKNKDRTSMLQKNVWTPSCGGSGCGG